MSVKKCEVLTRFHVQRVCSTQWLCVVCRNLESMAVGSAVAQTSDSCCWLTVGSKSSRADMHVFRTFILECTCMYVLTYLYDSLGADDESESCGSRLQRSIIAFNPGTCRSVAGMVINYCQ